MKAVGPKRVSTGGSNALINFCAVFRWHTSTPLLCYSTGAGTLSGAGDFVAKRQNRRAVHAKPSGLSNFQGVDFVF